MRDTAAPGTGRGMRGIATILIVDGDIALRRSLAEQLERDGEFACRQCADGAAALRLIRDERFDALLVDAALPDMKGRELCRRVRRAGVHAPILLLASEGEEKGGEDCLEKPLRLNVLLARLRAALERHEGSEDGAITIGPYTFRPGIKLLTDERGRRTVRLTDKEAAILQFLYRAGRAIGRDTLLGQVWGYNAGVTTHTLETHVYRLRRKIERDPAHAEILVTEPGGYRLLP